MSWTTLCSNVHRQHWKSAFLMVGQSIHERKLREERENQVADEPEENVECQMLQLLWPRVLFLIHICPAPLVLTR